MWQTWALSTWVRMDSAYFVSWLVNDWLRGVWATMRMQSTTVKLSIVHAMDMLNCNHLDQANHRRTRRAKAGGLSWASASPDPTRRRHGCGAGLNLL